MKFLEYSMWGTIHICLIIYTYAREEDFLTDILRTTSVVGVVSSALVILVGLPFWQTGSHP